LKDLEKFWGKCHEEIDLFLITGVKFKLEGSAPYYVGWTEDKDEKVHGIKYRILSDSLRCEWYNAGMQYGLDN
jgi:hypothetical protein